MDTSKLNQYREEGKEYYFLQPRSSMLGKSEDEIYKYFTTRDEMAEDSLAIMSAKSGTALHRLVQAQQYQLGNILTAESFIHNKDYNFTGHIDAISGTLGIGDIKTVSRSIFEKVSKFGPKDSHITQVNSYMKTTNNKSGYIQYVMREDPTQQVVFKLNLDEELFERDMAKIKRVQERVKEDLGSGKIKYSNLRQGESAKVLYEKSLSAHSSLEKDTEKIDSLVDQFVYYQNKLESKHKVKSNKALNSKKERRIEGMGHGWFGSQRKSNTDFGSPFRIGDYHQVVGMTDSEIDEYFKDQMGLDIETNSLKSRKGSTFQVAMAYGDDSYKSMFIKQESNKLSDFLDKSGVGDLKRKMNLDFTKEGPIQDYSKLIFGTDYLRKKIEAEIANEERVKKALTTFFNVAKTERKNILVANANFEIDHLKYITGNSNDINYSPEYLAVRKRIRQEHNLDLSKLKIGETTKDQVFNNSVRRHRELYQEILRNAKNKDGSIIEVLEAAKTLQAISQEKNLVPRTGNFSIGSNVENLASIFLGEKEIHEGVLDVSQQNQIMKKIVGLIRDIESGNAKPNNKYFSHFNNNLEEIFLSSYKKMIESDIASKGHAFDINPIRGLSLVSNSPINEVKLFNKAIDGLNPDLRKLANVSSTPSSVSNLKFFRAGMAIAGSALVYSALRNMFTFSGSDDAANEIEGMTHGGLASINRKLFTDFGSGFQKPEDPSSVDTAGLLSFGTTAGVIATNWNRKINMNVDDITYLGKMHATKTNSEILGRTEATVGDFIVGAVKRAESMMGGFPRSFGVGDALGTSLFNQSTFTIDVTKADTQSYAKYIDAIIKRKILEEGVESVTFSKGKLYLTKNNVSELVPGVFGLRRTSTDLNQVESMTQLTKAITRSKGVNYIDPKKFPFIPVGGKGMLNDPWVVTAKGYARETFSKYLRLMDEPFDAITELMPDINIPGGSSFKKITKHFPKLGVGGEMGHVGPVSKMISNHAVRLGAFGAAMYFGFGTLDWITRQVSPEGTSAGDAGILGIGAEGVRTIHQTYARISDASGFTGFRDYVDGLAPGMNGWQATLGLTLSGALAGGGYAAGEGLFKELTASGRRYEQFISNKKALESMPEFLKKLPGMGGEFTRFGKLTKLGALAGFTLALPWTIAGIGADKSFSELEEIYEGRKEVAVKKGRYWEASMTPWGGDVIDYHRPGWYARLRDDAKTAELYNGEDISPLGKFARSIIDPYWLEKRRWKDQPYPYAGPDGSSFGIFGALYEATIGRALKAPVLMHQDEFRKEFEKREKNLKISEELGGTSSDLVTPDDFSSLMRKQWSSFLEAVGLRGFAIGAVKELITGEKNISSYSEELANSSSMDSPVRAFHDLQLGGGIMTTEAIRRVFNKEEVGSVSRVNGIRNNMPSWLPGQNYYINFKEGDPFSKVKEGYYRLPGEGFATRHEDLKGVNPEDYPDIYKYKILADIAPGSSELKKVRERLQGRTLTKNENEIFEETERQIKEKEKSKEGFREDSARDSLLGRYSIFLTELGKSNPLEQLLPFSPAHKFLPEDDPMSSYERAIYGKTFKSWSRPIEDFVKPAINVGLKNLGFSAIPEEVEYARQLESYFDKIKHIKSMRLAEEARNSGNTGMAKIYEQQAAKTMSGLDPYGDSSEIKRIMPKREQKYFEKFLNASDSEKRKILELSPESMREIYLAQWDKQELEKIQQGSLEDDRDAELGNIKEIKERQSQLNAKRKARINNFKRSEEMPEDDWLGWDKRVDLEDVKMQFLINEGRDYHYYGLWQDRLRLLSRKPYVKSAAENLEFEPAETRNNYIEATERARSIGILNPIISMLPGLSPGDDLDIDVNREEERRLMLKDLGYVI